MALGWTTTRSIPHLRNYAEAKKWHDDVVPIRGDEHKTRPAGRRDQKWFSIWQGHHHEALEYNTTTHARETVNYHYPEGTVHIGYGSGELKGRAPIVSYLPDGMLLINARGGWSNRLGASSQERVACLTGISIYTYHYDEWVQARVYDRGVQVHGYWKLNRKEMNRFYRDTDGTWVFANAKPYHTKTLNRQAHAKVLAPYKETLAYLRSTYSLTSGVQSPEELYVEMFGGKPGRRYGRCADGSYGYQEVIVPNVPELPGPWQINHGGFPEDIKDQLLTLLRSSDHADRFKLYLWMTYRRTYYATPHPVERTMEMLRHIHADQLFKYTEHFDGKVRRDRYRKYGTPT